MSSGWKNRLGSGWGSIGLRRTATALGQPGRSDGRADFASRHRRKHLFFAHYQGGSVVARAFEPMPVSDRVSRTGLHAIPAEDTAVVINVVNLGVTFRTAVSLLSRVLRRLNINAVGRTCSRTKKTGNTFFETVLITLKNVRSPESRLYPSRSVRVRFRNSRLEEFLERDAHSLRNCGSRADYFTDFRHASFRVTQRNTSKGSRPSIRNSNRASPAHCPVVPADLPDSSQIPVCRKASRRAQEKSCRWQRFRHRRFERGRSVS
ncbi:MAG: hypothetical protein JWP08_2615 [Bryobacterales bacterium]|nr:hypothetical protein [Bryobacterales bacterium]